MLKFPQFSIPTRNIVRVRLLSSRFRIENWGIEHWSDLKQSPKRQTPRLCSPLIFLHVVLPSALESAPMSDHPSFIARREFLRFLAASPYVAAAGGMAAFLRLPESLAQNGSSVPAEVPADPSGALNV